MRAGAKVDVPGELSSSLQSIDVASTIVNPITFVVIGPLIACMRMVESDQRVESLGICEQRGRKGGDGDEMLEAQEEKQIGDGEGN